VPATTIFDSIDEVPESVRDKATEVEGKFHVSADALVTKHNEVLAEKKRMADDRARLQAEHDKYKDIDPEKARKALKDLEDAENEKLRIQGDWDARENALRTGFTTEKTTLEGEIASRDKMLDKFVVRNELARVCALPEIKGAFELLADNATVMNSIRRKGEDYEILDASGAVRYGTDGQPLRMEAYLKELREHPTLSRLFDPTGASGSGAGADTGRAGGEKVIDKNLRRSKMSDKEQQDFVRDHGFAKFRELPA
jgi:hypothetical protein